MQSVGLGQQTDVLGITFARKTGAAGTARQLQREGIAILGDEPGQMLAGVAAQAPHIGKQHATLALGAPLIAEPSDHRSHKGSQLSVVGRNRKSNVRGPSQEFADLLEGRELRFVHLDDHPSMIDLKPLAQPHMPLETRLLLQPPMPLEEATT